jgi:hypothetical protein
MVTCSGGSLGAGSSWLPQATNSAATIDVAIAPRHPLELFFDTRLPYEHHVA